MQQWLRQSRCIYLIEFSSFNLIEFVGWFVIFSNVYNCFSKDVALSYCRINYVLFYARVWVFFSKLHIPYLFHTAKCCFQYTFFCDTVRTNTSWGQHLCTPYLLTFQISLICNEKRSLCVDSWLRQTFPHSVLRAKSFLPRLAPDLQRESTSWKIPLLSTELFLRSRLWIDALLLHYSWPQRKGQDVNNNSTAYW